MPTMLPDAMTKLLAKKLKTRTWDAVEHLETEADMAAYLEAALSENDPALTSAALDDIARARAKTARTPHQH